MGKHTARCTRRRAEPGVSARVASSREAYYASGTLGVSLPPARHSAPPRCRLRITVAFSSFACLAPPSISESVDVWRIDGLLIPIWVYAYSYSYDRNRESIMMGPSKINNGGITFTLFPHIDREYGATLA